MRLKKLKLVGFKSFVDATSVDFPSELVAVVGPNGCGKSNIIDAVRWVMGESSVKHLRGESMSDVIFNGSSLRRPLGQASVELVFENNSGKLLGEYASYSEIAIKRVVTREGSSTYYLNNTRCRRKDVIDIFLGTGLGPRSYSIISQGMVSEVVEAKPDELRGFIEEAAGISKYKERRRETENRIKHTRENLERINDIREELGKHIDKLARQAQTARRYQNLKEEELDLSETLSLIRIKNFEDSLLSSNKRLSEEENRLGKSQTILSGLMRELEEEKVFVQNDEEHYAKEQGEYYQKGRELAKLEEGLAGLKAKKKQLELDNQECSFALKEYLSHIDELSGKNVSLSQDIEELEPSFEIILEEKEQILEVLAKEEQEQSQAQESWDRFNQALHRASNDAHREQARVQHLEETINETEARIKKLNNEKTTLTFSELEEDQARLDADIELLNEKKDVLEEDLLKSRDNIEKEQSSQKMLLNSIEKQSNELSSTNARLASLEALQEASLGKQNQSVSSWLKNNKLSDSPRAAELISVDAGYEVAVDAIFSALLSAVSLEKSTLQSLSFDDAYKLPLSMVWGEKNETSLERRGAYLSAHIKTDLSFINAQAAKVQIAKNLSDAQKQLLTLPQDELIVTLDGVILAQGYIKFPGQEKEEENVIVREKLIEGVKQEKEAITRSLAELKKSIETQEASLITLQNLKVEQEQSLKQLELDQRSMIGQVNLYKERLHQFKQRKQNIDEEVLALTKSLEENKDALISARANWQAAIEETDKQSLEREKLSEARESIRQKLSKTREQLNFIQVSVNEKSLALNSKKQERELINQSLSKEKERLTKAEAKQKEIEVALLNLSSEKLSSEEEALNEKLAKHVTLEEKIQELKIKLSVKKEKLNTTEKNITTQRDEISTIEQEIGKIKLDRQSEIVRLQTIKEELDKDDDEIKNLINELDEEKNESIVSEALDLVRGKIQRLGAVNLAAIEEHQAESTRKGYLDEQCADLEKALATLEDAIARIDKESKQRFKETFDLVNSEFKLLFPKLFGGGNAELICDSDDLLETGVSVIAQPPGKRNSTIHLLSGGEKAMTAVALVFSIFQLNPSPFCMLDEVDAPLDDANVSRFCKIVKEMSEHVQFIFITHNKLTMALASHLSGVTMNEPGVSRIVSVDVEKAVELAE